MTTQQIQSLVDAAASRYNVPPSVLQSIARTESSYDPNAVSQPNKNGTVDYGVMQINSANLAQLGLTPSQALDPATNINAGAQMFSQLLSQFNGNVTLAVAAYNAGPTAVNNAGGVPSYSQAYVDAVLAGAGLPSADPTLIADTSTVPTNGTTPIDTTSVVDLSAVSPTTWAIAIAIALAVLLLNNKR